MSYSRDLFAGAEFIGGAGHSLCRRSFVVPSGTRRALLRIVADSHHYSCDGWMPALAADATARPGNWLLGGSFIKYRLFCNGAAFGAGPFRAIRTGECVVHEFDVTPLLREGENVLAVLSRGERKGFAAVLELSGAPGAETRRIVSDDTWRSMDGNAIYRPVCWERQELFQDFKGGAGPGEWSEHIDGRIYPFGWTEAGFDDRCWMAATGRGAVTEELEVAELDNYVLAPVAPARVEKRGENHWFIDFGREMVAGIELTGPAAGGAVELRLSESVNADGRVVFQMPTFNCYQEIWTFPAGKERRLAHLGVRAFRYMELLDYPDFHAEALRAVTLTTPVNVAESQVELSHPDLNRVCGLCRDTIAIGSLDVYVDCPSRERIAYEADSYINMLTDLAVRKDMALARRSIFYQIEHPTWPAEWGMFMIPLVYRLVLASGETAVAAQLYDRLATEFTCHGLADATGLVRTFPQRIIVDWPESQRDGYEFGEYNTVANSFVYWNLKLLAELAGWLGKTADAADFRARAEQWRAALNAQCFDPVHGLYRDTPTSKHCSGHANMFAVAFGIAEAGTVDKIADFLVEKGMFCSVYGAQFLLEALFMARRDRAAVALMAASGKHSWLDMLAQGATATFEAWSLADKGNMSRCHAWGSAPGNIIPHWLFGLRPTRPGWTEYVFDPQPGGVDAGSIRLPTVRGTLCASFRHAADGTLEKTCVWR